MEQKREACAACRRMKIRCLDNEDRSRACQRCARIGETCEYNRKKRGRRPVVTQRVQGDTDRGNNPTSVSRTPDSLAMQPEQRSNVMPSPGPALLVGPRPSTNSPVATVGGGEFPTSVDVSSHLDPGESSTTPVQQHQQDTMFQSGLVPGHGFDRAPMDTVATSNYDCPITLGLLSSGEAAMLVAAFHTNLNPMIALLDPDFHTLDQLRSTSACLLSSVVSAASKFFRPDLHRILRDHSLAILSRAVMGHSACDTGVVQSLMIHVYWKAPTDRTAWAKLGMAIRLGYQFRWHEGKRNQTGMDERALRRALDSHRTWLCLYCFDQSYSRTFKLPSTITAADLGDVHQWVDDHRYLNIGIDNHLASSVEAMTIDMEWQWMSHSTLSVREATAMHVPRIRTRTESHRDKWYRLPTESRQMSPNETKFLDWLASERSLDIERYTIGASTTDEEVKDALHRCLIAVAGIVEGVETLSDCQVLRYLQDVASCILSNAASFVKEYFWQFTTEQRNIAVTFLRRIYGTCMKSAAGDNEAATAFVARFVRRTLREMTNQSTAPTRGASPAADFDQPIVDPYLFDVNAWMPEAGLLPENPVLDDAYWASLFSGSIHDV